LYQIFSVYKESDSETCLPNLHDFFCKIYIYSCYLGMASKIIYLSLAFAMLMILIYNPYQFNGTYFNLAIATTLIFLYMGLISNGLQSNTNVYERFQATTDANDSNAPEREARYSDIAMLWTWSNTFLRFNTNNSIDVSGRLSKPEEVPRAGWTWEYLIIEDPKEIAPGFGNNNNPLRNGDKILIRSSYKISYMSIPPNDTRQQVMSSDSRGDLSQFQIVSSGTGAKQGDTIKFGDSFYLKTSNGSFLTVDDNGLLKYNSVQSNKSLLTIYDRFGQGRMINWARRGTATHSSNYENFIPNNAIDGNPLTFNHTQADRGAWWQLTLPREIMIDRIELFNRRDCCQDRLSNFDVSILDENGGLIDKKFFPSGGNGQTPVTWLNVSQTGRLIKVQLRGQNYLHLSEVNVYGQAISFGLSSEKQLSADLLMTPQIYNSSETKTMTFPNTDLPSSRASRALSVSMFIKLTKTNATETQILHKGNSSMDSCPAITVVPNSSQLRFYYMSETGNTSAGGAKQYFDDPQSLPLNQWIHLAYTLSSGVSVDSGWQLGSFAQKLTSPPYETCCYYIHPALKQYYWISSALSTQGGQSNIWDPSILTGMTYLGVLPPQMMKPYAMVYINGLARPAITLPSGNGTTSAPKFNTAPLAIGKSPKLELKCADFAIDQLKYYNYQIQPNQISKLIQTPLLKVTKTLADQIGNTMPILKFENNELPYVETDLTVNFWIQTTRPTTGTGQLDRIFFKGIQDSDRAPAMWWTAKSNKLSMPFRTNNQAQTNGEGIQESSFAIPPNEWHHVALTLRDKIQTLYYDGKQMDQVTLSDKVIFIPSPLSIGGFLGQMANFQFSNFAMEPSQIQMVMGQHPDEIYNRVIRQIWRETGCLTDPIPPGEPFKFPEWKTLIKTDQRSRVEGQIAEIKKTADNGNKANLELCYGKFTAGMLGKLAEKDQVIKFALEKQKTGLTCLPMAPFECKTKTINDYDIRSHKDFNRYVISAQKCAPQTSAIDITQNNNYLRLKQELESSQATIKQLQGLKSTLIKESDRLTNSVNQQCPALNKTNLTETELLEYPQYKSLKAQSHLQQENLRKVENRLQFQLGQLKKVQDQMDLQSKVKIKIEDHPQYPELIRRLEKEAISKQNAVKCWGCEIPKTSAKN
jgi:hypothetical protein